MLGHITRVIPAPHGNASKLSNTSPEGLIVLSIESHIVSHKGLRIPRLSKVLPKGLSVSVVD